MVIIMEDVGKKLLKYIEASNYTQTSFAKKMNISLSTLNKYVLNKRQIPLDNLVRFAKELNFSLDHFLGVMDKNSISLNKDELELIKQLRQLNSDDYDKAYKSIYVLLELINKENER